MLTKIKNFCKDNEENLILAIIIILVGLISFGLGRISKIEEGRVPVKIDIATTTKPDFVVSSTGEKVFVASKNGTKYHYIWCPGAQSIKEENKIYFSTKEEAERSGYQPASNCPGLK